MFITFEGGEGSGKTTLIQKLKVALEKSGHQVLATREPGGSELGEYIRDCLLNPDFGISFGEKAELMLYLASRVQHIEEVIKPALEQGKVILCDRFNDSSIAYQGGGRRLGIEKVRSLCEMACDGLAPNLTFFLDLDPEAGMRRLTHKKDRLESEEISFHRRVREAFQQIAAQDPKRVHLIDATQTPDEVFAQVVRIVDF